MYRTVNYEESVDDRKSHWSRIDLIDEIEVSERFKEIKKLGEYVARADGPHRAHSVSLFYLYITAFDDNKSFAFAA